MHYSHLFRIRALLAQKCGQDANLHGPSFNDATTTNTSASQDESIKLRHDEDEGCQKLRQSSFTHSKLEVAGSRQPSLLMNSSLGGATAVVMAAKTSCCLSGDDELETETAEELEKRITTLIKMVEAKQQAIDECSYRLSGVYLGQDRFSRNYFVLGSVGGIFIENTDPSSFNPDAIVSKIKARRELATMRYYNCTGSSKTAVRRDSSILKMESPYVKSTDINVEPEQIGKEGEEDEEEEDDDEGREEEVEEEEVEILNDESEKREEPIIENVEVNEGCKIKLWTECLFAGKGVEAKKEEASDHESNAELVVDFNNELIDTICVEQKEEEEEEEEEKVSELQKREDETLGLEKEAIEDERRTVVEMKINEKETGPALKQENKREKEERDEEEEVTGKEDERGDDGLSLQPLDLSHKPKWEAEKQPVINELEETAMTTANSVALCQSLSERELAAALEAANLDDTFLTTAALLYVTQTGILDRSSIGPGSGMWNQSGDPNWHIIVLFYKLQLLHIIAFEVKTSTPSLSSALQQLKRWLNDGETMSSKDTGHDEWCDEKDDEKLIPEIEKLLEERGVQTHTAFEEQETVTSSKSWCRVRGMDQLESLLSSLSLRGIRELMLLQAIRHDEETVGPSVLVDASTGRLFILNVSKPLLSCANFTSYAVYVSVLDIEKVSTSLANGWKPSLLRVRSRRGKGRGNNLPFYSSASSSNLAACLPIQANNINPFLVAGNRLPACNSTAELTVTSDLSNSDSSPYSLRQFRELSEASMDPFSPTPVENLTQRPTDRSVFVEDNYQRVMNFELEGDDCDFHHECRFLELVESLVDRVLSASLQTKGWQVSILHLSENAEISLLRLNGFQDCPP